MTQAGGKFLLDTNIIIAIFGGDEAALSNLNHAAEVFIPAVAIGELFFGAADDELVREVQRVFKDRVVSAKDLDVF